MCIKDQYRAILDQIKGWSSPACCSYNSQSAASRNLTEMMTTTASSTCASQQQIQRCKLPLILRGVDITCKDQPLIAPPSINLPTPLLSPSKWVVMITRCSSELHKSTVHYVKKCFLFHPWISFRGWPQVLSLHTMHNVSPYSLSF